tara:strand:- start:49 stop:333 length:285 start_codon:yes stop_codon:yes gene_type:complete
MSFLVIISLVLLPWILGGLKFIKNPSLGTLILSGSISYSFFQISWWSIVLPILLSLFVVYSVNPINEAAKQRVDCQTGLIIGCIIGIIISFFTI